MVKILLVEDNPIEARMAIEALKLNNIEEKYIVHASTGSDAITCFLNSRVNEFDLVLLDMKLPDISGIEILKKIKETSFTPVVMLTASRQEDDILEAYINKVNGYVQKPVDFNEFVEVVRRLASFWLHTNCVPAENWGK